MNVYQIVIIGIVGAVLALTIKKESPMIALLLSLMTSVLIFMLVLPNFTAVLNLTAKISESISADVPFVTIVLKIIGVAYICEFGAQICVDAGESSIAGKIELAGKILIMGIAAPVILALVNEVLNLY